MKYLDQKYVQCYLQLLMHCTLETDDFTRSYTHCIYYTESETKTKDFQTLPCMAKIFLDDCNGSAGGIIRLRRRALFFVTEG